MALSITTLRLSPHPKHSTQTDRHTARIYGAFSDKIIIETFFPFLPFPCETRLYLFRRPRASSPSLYIQQTLEEWGSGGTKDTWDLELSIVRGKDASPGSPNWGRFEGAWYKRSNNNTASIKASDSYSLTADRNVKVLPPVLLSCDLRNNKWGTAQFIIVYEVHQ